MRTALLACALLACRGRSEVAPTPTEIVTGSTECPAALLAAREGGLEPGRYVAPTAEEARTLRDAFAFDLARVAEAGFAIEDLGHDLILVRERERRRGGGAYLLRKQASSRLIVQAPHTFFDEGTLPLACELFARGHAAALFVETAHRYRAAEQTASGVHPADVAHARDSFFQAATEGLLRARRAQRPVVVQLHGFQNREVDFSVVLSGGIRRHGLSIVNATGGALSRLLSARGARGAARFPDDQDDLGATTNVQGALVRELGSEFLHVEMSASLRRALLDDAGFRASFLATLADATEGA